MRAGPRDPDRLPRRLRPRRGGRAGGVRGRGRALAAATASPANPGAWIVTTARNRAIDRLRRERTLRAKTALLERPSAHDGRGGPDDDDPPTSGCADLHLLPPGARARGAGRADAAHARRARRRAEIARAFLVARGDDGAAPRSREAQDPATRASRSACRPTTCSPTGSRGARGRLPDLQRGLRRAGGRPVRPRRSGSAASLADADAGRAGGAGLLA